MPMAPNQLGRQSKVMIAQFLPPILQVGVIGDFQKGMAIEKYATEITALATAVGAYLRCKVVH